MRRNMKKNALDVDDAMFAGIKAASKPNVGYARSPALTEAASIVRYWRAQISSNRNNVGLSCGIRTFALKHSLPTSVLLLESIITKLNDAWKALRVVQQTAEEERSKWIDEKGRCSGKRYEDNSVGRSEAYGTRGGHDNFIPAYEVDFKRGGVWSDVDGQSAAPRMDVPRGR